MYRDRAIGGRSETGVAVVNLVNTDGEFDDYNTRYSLAGRDAVLWMGTDEPGVTFANLLADPSKRATESPRPSPGGRCSPSR